MKKLLILIVISLFGLAACGEVEQVVVYKQGKYQGKPDTRSWDNEPLAPEHRAGNWKKGDRTSWEEQIRTRTLTQDEYRRVGH